MSITPADTLLLYLELLRRAQNEALRRSALAWGEAHERVTRALEQLAQVASALEAALKDDGLLLRADVAAASQITRAALVANSQGALEGARALYAASLEAFSRVASRQQQGPVLLSQRAVAELRRLLDQLDEVRRLQTESQQFQRFHLAAFDRTEGVVIGMQDLLVRASSAIATSGDRPAPGLSNPEGPALIREARRRLPEVYGGQPPGEEGRMLDDILEGSALWAEGELPPLGNSMVQPVSLSSRAQSGPEQSIVQPRLAELLNKYCPDATGFRCAMLALLVMPIWVLHSTPEQRRPRIATALQFFRCKGQLHHDEAFVGALASLFTGARSKAV